MLIAEWLTSARVRRNGNMIAHRYVFVAGLHRSGTSLIARLIARLPGIAAIKDAPVPENEGVYLKGAIPHTARQRVPMHFATDPAQYLVEGCAWDRLEVRQRLEADWAPWFDPGSWRVEKSPVNLTRMRLYQQLFPLSQFVVVIRHPQAVAAAVAKWTDASTGELIDHWVAAHRLVDDDLSFLHAAMVVRYEEVVARPDIAFGAFAAFLDLSGNSYAPEETIRNGNEEYGFPESIRSDQTTAIAAWGYASGGRCRPAPFTVRHPLRRIRGRTMNVLGGDLLTQKQVAVLPGKESII